jgi:hypothetical protein
VGDNRAVSLDERFEQLIAFLGSQLPGPVDQEQADEGSLVFTGGTPPEVIVQLTKSNVTVLEYAGFWDAPERFIVKPRHVGTVKWRRLPETAMMNAVSALIKGAREIRLHRYRHCSVCDEKTPPESLVGDDDVCTACTGQQGYLVH